MSPSRRQALSPLSPSELPWLCSQPTVRANNNRLFSGEEESESRKMLISLLAILCHTRRTVLIKMVSMIVLTIIIIKNKSSIPKVLACVMKVPLHMYYLSNHSLFWWSKILSEPRMFHFLWTRTWLNLKIPSPIPGVIYRI